MARLEEKETYSCLLVCFIVFVFIAITAVPSVFYYLHSHVKKSEPSPTARQGNGSLKRENIEGAESLRFETVSRDFLLSSVCRSYLPWLHDFYDRDVKRNDSSRTLVLDNGCGMQRTEDDLRRLFHLASLLSEKCSALGLSLVCTYHYRTFVNGSLGTKHWPTKSQCEEVMLTHCPLEWRVVENILRSRGYCIRLPDCDLLTDRPGNRNQTNERNFQILSSKTVPLKSGINDLRNQGNKTTSCKLPFVPSSSIYSRCSPPCPADQWLLRKESLLGTRSTAIISGIVLFTSLFIIIYTWMKVNKLRQFPHIITLLAAMFFLLAGLSIIAAFVVGRDTAYCSHNDILSSWHHPTSFCVAQATTRALFYSFTVPSQVVGVGAVTMSLLIIKRLKQSSKFQAKEGAINKKVKVAGVIITRHFLVLVTGIPVVFVTAFTMFEAYAYFSLNNITKDTTLYILCQQTNSSSDCISFADDIGLVVLHCVIPVCVAAVAVLLMVYSLFPGPARKLWKSHFRSIFRCRKADKKNEWRKIIFKTKDDKSREIPRDYGGDIDKIEMTDNVDWKLHKIKATDVRESNECVSRLIKNQEEIGKCDFSQSNSDADMLEASSEKTKRKPSAGQIRRRAFLVKELKRTAEPVKKTLMKVVSVSEGIKRMSSFQKCFRHSQSMRRHRRRASTALETVGRENACLLK
ncbi:uncharacterized protein LOC134183217 isoform X2 [Corticium candelabrum]|uniref:uncharacterized protein LOC134183217 isoform X2 n=1 Tax=Corticium candelabrum TaxID=121492 RepID=UPI002E25FB5E|nr:uncharacterized protein LOC134183217 isoform X2 [Corticium candelabrum]